MTADQIISDNWAESIIFANQNGKTTQGIFQNGEIFFNMVFSIHSKFCSSSTCNYHYVFICSGCDQWSSVDKRMNRSGTKRSYIRTGCIDSINSFCKRFSEVAATSLIHITTSFFRTFNNVIYTCNIYIIFLYQVFECKNSWSFCNKIFKHYMRI